MRYFITVDGGTTNTRVALVKEEQILETKRIALGARAGIDGKKPLAEALKDAIAQLLKTHGVAEAEVECILASGMITSEYGLCTLPHLLLPAGLKELHNGMKKVVLKEISPIPFCFIPGVKVLGEDFLSSDMIRGEETELMGILDRSFGDCVYVLPGSHSKVIKTNRDGKIENFSTLLSGEMAQALSENTILRGAVELSVDSINEEYLKKGYFYCREHGINQGLFKVRILKVLFGGSPEEAYSFFLGAVLCGEVGEILRYDAETVVVGGKRQLREALATILNEIGSMRVITLTEDEVQSSVTRGMLRIYGAK
ncbi:MAG: hypothetical protein E7629_06765 [Ruminococcaceae bacterium]|nr:hypothetical protein [Oscillospiraceae bacterium]